MQSTRYIVFVLLFSCMDIYACSLEADKFSLCMDCESGNFNISNPFFAPIASSVLITATPSSVIENKLSTGTALGTIGVIGWTSGKFLEIIGLVKLLQNGEGPEVLITGIILDLGCPILSCAGESVVMRGISYDDIETGNNDKLELKDVGWGFYGKSFFFLGAAIGINFIAYSTQLPAFTILGNITGGVGEVFRGIAAIAPLARIFRVKRNLKIHTQTTMTIRGKPGFRVSILF